MMDKKIIEISHTDYENIVRKVLKGKDQTLLDSMMHLCKCTSIISYELMKAKEMDLEKYLQYIKDTYEDDFCFSFFTSLDVILSIENEVKKFKQDYNEK